MFANIRQCDQIVKNHSKVTKMHLWMIQSVKKEVFGHYPDLGVLDQLDIAYCDTTKCFLTIGNVTRSLRIIQKPRKCIFEWATEPKIRFSAIFRRLACWIDLVLHIVIVLNVLLHVASVPGHAGSFKIHKNPFLNDQKSQKSHWIGCILHILILINNVHGLVMVSINFCDINIPKWTSWNWLEVKKSWFELKLSTLLDSVTVLNVSWGQASYSRLVR